MVPTLRLKGNAPIAMASSRERRQFVADPFADTGFGESRRQIDPPAHAAGDEPAVAAAEQHDVVVAQTAEELGEIH